LTTMNPLIVLLGLNILLQVFDGVATAQGLRLGIHEGNHLLAAAFEYWGVGVSLLAFKSFACGALMFVYVAAPPDVARKAFGAIAAIYCACSLVPWLVALSGLLPHVR
jgi:hypothetical protein